MALWLRLQDTYTLRFSLKRQQQVIFCPLRNQQRQSTTNATHRLTVCGELGKPLEFTVTCNQINDATGQPIGGDGTCDLAPLPNGARQEKTSGNPASTKFIWDNPGPAGTI